MRSGAWHQCKNTVRYEFKLILRDPAFRGLFILAQLALLFYGLHYGLDRPAQLLLADLVGAFGLALPVVAAVYAVHSLRRPGLEGADEVLSGLSTRPAPELWGRLTAGALVGAILVLEPLLVGAALGWGKPDLPGLIVYHGAFLVANLGLAIAFGALAAVFLGRSALSYAAAPAAWIGYVAVTNYLVYGRGLEWGSLGAGFSFGLGFHRTDALWGAWLDLPLALPQFAFLVLLSLALMSLAALAHRPGRDPGRPRWRTLAILVLALALAFPAGQAYLQRLDARLASIGRQLELEALTDPLDFPPPGVIRITGYDITLWLERDGTLLSEAALEVVNGGAEPLASLSFILNGVLAVEAVAVDGFPAAFESRGHRLEVDLGRDLNPGEGCRVELRYGGKVESWNRWGLAGPALVAGSWSRGARLPAGFGWYPLTGQTAWISADPPSTAATLCAPTFEADPGGGPATVTGLRYAAREPGVVSFELAVHSPPGYVLESNLTLQERAGGWTRFSGLAEEGCYLLGAPNLKGLTTAGGLKIVGPGALELEALQGHVLAVLDCVRGLTGHEDETPPVITVLTHDQPWRGPVLGGSLTLSPHELRLSLRPEELVAYDQVFGWAFGRTFNRLSFGLEDSFEPAMIREACLDFARALFFAGSHGEDSYLASRDRALERQANFPVHPLFPEAGNPAREREQYRQVVETLFRYADTRGLQAASQLMASLHPAIKAGELDLAGLLRAAGEGK